MDGRSDALVSCLLEGLCVREDHHVVATPCHTVGAGSQWLAGGLGGAPIGAWRMLSH